MYLARAALRSPVSSVASWLDRSGHAGLVVPGLDGTTTFVDLGVSESLWASASPEEDSLDELTLRALTDLAVDQGCTVVSLSLDHGELSVHEPGSVAREALPAQAERVLGLDGLAELFAPDLRFQPPRGQQVLVVTTPSDDSWAVTMAVLDTDLTIVRLDGWSVVGAPHADLMPAAHGLVAGGNECGLLISRHESSWAFEAFRRGKPRTGHLRLAGTVVVGAEGVGGPLEDQPAEPTADAETVAACLGTPEAQDNVSLVRALLRRPPAVSHPSELIDLLGLGPAGSLAVEVLDGADLGADPRAETALASGSTLKNLLTLVSGGPLPTERVPWVPILYAAWLLLLLPLAVENLADLLEGRLDGWDVAQLVGCAISIPVSVVSLLRVLSWLGRRRT